MEILTWVLEGALAHRDSLGHQQSLVPGEIQVMTAGRVIRHSEFNASDTEPVRFLQMWVLPDAVGHDARYDQKAFAPAGRADAWQTLASPDERDGSLPIRADAVLRVSDLSVGHTLDASVDAGRFGWLHVATGAMEVDGEPVGEGDAVSFGPGGGLKLTTSSSAQFLLFDLA